MPTEIVVADNGLPAETARALMSEHVRIVAMGGNRGFAAAVNSAVRRTEGGLLIVLNDDIAPIGDLVGEFARSLDDGAAVAAGVLIRAEQPDRIETAGIEIDGALSAYDYLYDRPLTCLDAPVPPPLGPCGAAAAYRRDAFLEAGGFDEGFFAYCEDVDLAIRMHALGARTVLAQRARAVHSGSATAGRNTVHKAALVGFSRGYLLRKYGVLRHPRWGPSALLVETAASLGLAGRHRSLAPARARLRGWRTCRAREARPSASAVGVPLGRGLRARRARSRPPRGAASSSGLTA